MNQPKKKQVLSAVVPAVLIQYLRGPSRSIRLPALLDLGPEFEAAAFPIRCDHILGHFAAQEAGEIVDRGRNLSTIGIGDPEEVARAEFF